jgi:hypothetical protein
MVNVLGNQAPAKQQKMSKKFENSSTKTVAEHRCDQIWSLPGDLNKKFEPVPHCSFITTPLMPTHP